MSQLATSSTPRVSTCYQFHPSCLNLLPVSPLVSQLHPSYLNLLPVSPLVSQLATSFTPRVSTCYQFHPSCLNLLPVSPLVSQLATSFTPRVSTCYQFHPSCLNLLPVSPLVSQLATSFTPRVSTCYQFSPLVSQLATSFHPSCLNLLPVSPLVSQKNWCITKYCSDFNTSDSLMAWQCYYSTNVPVDNMGTSSSCRGSLQWRARWTKLRKRTRGQNDTGERHLAITDGMFRSPSPLLHGSYQGTYNANNLGRLKDVSSPASVVAQNTSATNEALMKPSQSSGY